jgi:hypothetical protein
MTMVKALIIGVTIGLSLVLGGGQAQAKQDDGKLAGNFIKMWDADPYVRQLPSAYINGIVSGINWTEAMHAGTGAKGLVCFPQGLDLTPEQVLAYVRVKISGRIEPSRSRRAYRLLRRMCSIRTPQASGQSFRIVSSRPEAASGTLSARTRRSGL